MTVVFPQPCKTHWMNCHKDGNCWHEVGWYSRDDVKYLSFRCLRCWKVTLSDQKVEATHDG